MHRAVDSTMVLLFLNVPGKRWDKMFWKKRLVYRRHGCGVLIPFLLRQLGAGLAVV
jgi:hypothetical protein